MDYTELMKEAGFERGKSNPCAFWHPVREIRCVVHGDDFRCVGMEETVGIVLESNQEEV